MFKYTLKRTQELFKAYKLINILMSFTLRGEKRIWDFTDSKIRFFPLGHNVIVAFDVVFSSKSVLSRCIVKRCMEGTES